IMGYSDILPHFSRAEKPATDAIMNPSNFKSYISFLFPMATSKNDAWFETDVSMRNLYMGTTTFIFLVFSLLSKKTKEQLFFIIIGLFFILIAAGGIIGRLIYEYLPLIGFVRLPGEYSIFAILCFSLAAGFALDNFMKIAHDWPAKLALVLKTSTIVVLAAFTFSFSHIVSTHDSILWHMTATNGSMVSFVKLFLDNLSFYDCLVLQSLIQFPLIIFITKSLRHKNYNLMLYLCIADLVLASLLNLPFTGVGQNSVKNVQQVLNTSPKGIPIPALQPIIANDTSGIDKTSLTGNWSFYNKQPGVTTLVPYPILLNTSDQIFSPANKNSFLKPIIFSTKATAIIVIKKFTGQQITLDVVATDKDTIVWQQSNYPHWKAFVNDMPTPMLAYRGIYMATLISPGHHKVDFEFKPVKVKTAMLISAVAITLSVIYLLLIWIFPSWQQKRLHP
ncbi:MAG: hypothetical protein ABIT81_10285, partial [Ferruginibacter sp.]